LFTDSVTLHVMVEGGLVYLCASESDFGKRQPYAFLNEVGLCFEHNTAFVWSAL